jgi:hypothetical protein
MPHRFGKESVSNQLIGFGSWAMVDILSSFNLETDRFFPNVLQRNVPLRRVPVF